MHLYNIAHLDFSGVLSNQLVLSNMKYFAKMSESLRCVFQSLTLKASLYSIRESREALECVCA